MTGGKFLSKKLAMAVLQPRLKFGNPEQIEARQWLEAAKELEGCEVECECENCHGTGLVNGDFDPQYLRTVGELRRLVAEVEERKS